MVKEAEKTIGERGHTAFQCTASSLFQMGPYAYPSPSRWRGQAIAKGQTFQDLGRCLHCGASSTSSCQRWSGVGGICISNRKTVTLTSRKKNLGPEIETYSGWN